MRILIQVSPSAEVSCPADVGPSQPTGEGITECNTIRAVPLGKRSAWAKSNNICQSVRSLHIYHLFCRVEGALNSQCAVNVEHLYVQRFAH